MGDIEAARELELVKQALVEALRFRGFCEWQQQASRRIREQPPALGVTPEIIKALLCEYVAKNPESVQQIVEKRPEFSDLRYYYKVILRDARFQRGLFVEMVLVDDDPDSPAVSIVNAHE